MIKKIKLNVVNDDAQHFVVTFGRPGIIEILVINGEIMAHVYDGDKIRPDQEPIGGYDATLGAPFAVTGNEDWVA